MRIFDVHVHYPFGPGRRAPVQPTEPQLPPERADYLAQFAGREAPPQEQAPQSPQERVDYLAAKLREAGIVKACLLSGSRVPGMGISHEEALRTMEPHKDLFVPVAVVDPGTTPPERVRELHAMGYRGLKIIGTAKDLDDPDYFPIYEVAEELGMPILFHLGVIGGGLDYARTHPRRDPAAAEMYRMAMERLAQPTTEGQARPLRRNVSAMRMHPFHLDTLATNFPRLKMIGAHLGGTGNYDAAASVARWRHFVWFDLSGGEVIERHAMERGYIGREIAVEKLVWGSDCRPDEVLTHVRRFEAIFALLNLSEDEKERIWYRNAAEIYGFEEPQLAAP